MVLGKKTQCLPTFYQCHNAITAKHSQCNHTHQQKHADSYSSSSPGDMETAAVESDENDDAASAISVLISAYYYVETATPLLN